MRSVPVFLSLGALTMRVVALPAPDISVTIFEGVGATSDDDPGICWRVCFPVAIDCPGSGKSTQFGDCYTCCFKPSGDDDVTMHSPKHLQQVPSAHVPAISSELAGSKQGNGDDVHDACLMLCMFEEPQSCGERGYSKKFGECWTCCLKTGGSSTSESRQYLSLQQDRSRAVSVQKNPEPIMAQSICMRACFPEEPTCPEGWGSEQMDSCWTCCLKGNE